MLEKAQWSYTTILSSIIKVYLKPQGMQRVDS